jgi:phosphoribosyl 1,2-cyclic phosphodiesterase
MQQGRTAVIRNAPARGNTSCVELRADGEIIVLDAGTGIRALGHALAAEFRDQPLRLTLLLSHTHWDHIQGFPFFLPAYERRNTLRILGYEGARQGLAATLGMQMESPYFPVGMKELPGNITVEELREMEFRVGAVEVCAMVVNHPGLCVGYRLRTSGGDVVYIPDNESAPDDLESAAARRLLEFIRGAAVLIMDAQYDRAEYAQHIGWGHGCVDAVAALAARAGVKQLFLFHHDPEHDDARVAELVAHARHVATQHGAGAIRIESAREGSEFELLAE